MSSIKMNKYITALLVVLATTGVEAQTYQSALKAVLGDVAIENPNYHQVYKEFEDNIINILKSINEENDENKVEPTHAKLFACHIDITLCQTIKDSYSLNIPKNKVVLPSPSTNSSIFIRGPNA
ncbi:hypothetical protein HMPREF3218_0200700 [Prevotella bivia]|nr:hypothetical protein HMPREF3218_0200700 [Prevotella bivia]